MRGTEAEPESDVTNEQAAGAAEAFSAKSLWSSGPDAYTWLTRLVGADSREESKSADVSKGLSAVELAGYTVLTMAVMVGTALSLRQWIK